jgi:hypothetical protein
MLTQFAEKEWKGEQHIGETPVQIIEEVKEHGDNAVTAIDAVTGAVTKNKEEFERLKNDMYCYKALAYHYAQKAEAALHVLKYKYSNDVKDLEEALPLLEQSIISYRQLVQLTKGTYLYANSMQTQQRKIPLRGVDGTFKTWKEVLVPFQNELRFFRHKIDSLKDQKAGIAGLQPVLTKADINLLSINNSWYTVDSSSEVFSDTASGIMAFAKELKGLQGVQLSFQQQVKEGTELKFSNTQPVKVLVGFFNSKDRVYSQAPELETNASANDYGQAEIKMANAVIVKGLPPLNIHSYTFNAGTNTLKLAKGVCLILGFVKGDQLIPVYDAGLTENGIKKEIDWLFE